MTRVIPRIFNGNAELIISESFGCQPSKGIKVNIPLHSDKSCCFEFIFIKDLDPNNKNLEIILKDNNLKFISKNFVSPLGASLTQPYNFHIDNESFILQLYGVSLGSDFLYFSISIFRVINEI